MLNVKHFLVSAKQPLSVHLSGDNYIGYDLSHIGGAGQPILAERWACDNDDSDNDSKDNDNKSDNDVNIDNSFDDNDKQRLKWQWYWHLMKLWSLLDFIGGIINDDDYREHLHLEFRTGHHSGLLFFTG